MRPSEARRATAKTRGKTGGQRSRLRRWSIASLLASPTTPQPRSISIPSPASVWEKIAGFITGLSPSTLGVTGAVTAIVLVAQAATISILMVRDKTGSGAYHMAPGDPAPPAADGVQLLVTLQPGATASTLTSALSELKATVLDGPTAGGVYRLRLAGASGDSPAGLAEVKAKADVFAFVGPAPR